MADICSCTTGIVNFGQPACVDSFLRDARLIFVNYLDDSGAVNSVKSTDTLDDTFFDGKYNGASDIRWYPTETINNVVGVREDNVTQDIDGIPFSVKQGQRMYDGTFYGGIASPTYKKSLDSISCRQMGFYIIDVAGNLIGMKNDITGDLDPIKVQRNTFQSKYTFPSATEVQNMNLKFMYEENEIDSDLSYIKASDITIDLLVSKAMSTVVLGAATAISTTGFTTAATWTYGSEFTKLPLEGLVFGDFVIYNETTMLAVVPLTAPESPDGTYAVTFAAQTLSDVLTVTVSKVSGTGFETASSISVTIV